MSTRAQILAEIAAQLPDNSTGFITPAKLRQVVEDIATSYNNSTDEGTPAAAVAGDGRGLVAFFAAGTGRATIVARPLACDPGL